MIWHETRRHDIAHRWLREVVVEELGRFAPRLTPLQRWGGGGGEKLGGAAGTALVMQAATSAAQ